MGSSGNGKTNLEALITGVTGNIGNAVYHELLDADWIVHGIARHVLYSNDNGIEMEPFDLTQPWEHINLWQRFKHYQYDLVVMTHGVARPCTLETMTETDWSYIINGNLASAIGLTQALIKENKLADGALLVYCSSIQANAPRTGRGLYGIAKTGLETLAKTVAIELAPKNIRSIALRLGQLEQTMKGIQFPESEKMALQERALLPWIDPVDVASFIHELYFQKAITGCVIDFDSGQGRNIW